MTIRCENCRYFKPWPSTSMGSCHRFPPQVFEHSGHAFPVVESYNWCGEFSPKDQNDLETILELQHRFPDIFERVRRQIMRETDG